MQNTPKSIFKNLYPYGFLILLLIFLVSIRGKTKQLLIYSPPYAHNDTLYYPHLDSSDHVIHHSYYDLVYSETHEQAKWVFHKLYPYRISRSFERKNDFRSDPMVLSGSANHIDYRGSGYDRGHLMPAADMSWSKQGMSESFYYSNMSPQHPSFNRGVWKRLESRIRKWAIEYDSLYVFTGPVLEADLPSIGINQVSIPNWYYKVVLRFDKGKETAIGFLMKNKASKESLQTFANSIDDIERMIEIDFFSALPENQEKILERNSDVLEWSWD